MGERRGTLEGVVTVRFTETSVPGAFVIDLEPHTDDRGSFARGFCAEEFGAHGLEPNVAQMNLSSNPRRGTLRGLHLQRPPAGEAKTVRCARGAIYDVIVDLRPGSPTHLQHVAVELTAENGRALYVPQEFAHGFVTLTDDTLVTYQVSHPYTPGAEEGLRWDDPALGIDWPLRPEAISEKDAAWPLLEDRS